MYKEWKRPPKFVALLKKEKGKTAINEWENDDFDFPWALYNVYKKIRTIFFPYLLTCWNKDTSVLLKVKVFEQVHKYENNGLNFLKNTMYVCTIPLIKSYDLRKVKSTSHAIIHLTIFTSAFCQMHVENLLQRPAWRILFVSVLVLGFIFPFFWIVLLLSLFVPSVALLYPLKASENCNPVVSWCFWGYGEVNLEANGVKLD